ncbi:MAG: ethylbenzene dehydrogenase-related protein [Planctomycetes bacterium]|nr:ethylbenzene dehydrogenase-related protein [Planctomycetota bacterium]
MKSSSSLLFALALGIVACAKGKPPAVPVEVVVQPNTGALPDDPSDARWQSALEYPAALIPQDMVEPRQMQISTREVKVRALSDGSRIAFRLEWSDATEDDLPMPATFSDACAVQLPAATAQDVPAPQMGETGRPVEITLWRASWQATVDGRGDTIQDIHPNAVPDHYPFQADALEPGSDAQRAMELRFAPARALGNAMSGPRAEPVEDLVAQGPGTLTPAAATSSTGRGERTANGWAVVLTRRVPDGLAAGKRTQVAFAVWEGSGEEVGARKMRTGWTPLLIEVKP